MFYSDLLFLFPTIAAVDLSDIGYYVGLGSIKGNPIHRSLGIRSQEEEFVILHIASVESQRYLRYYEVFTD